MTTETKVTRFVPTAYVRVSKETQARAAEEANAYKFMRLGNRHYVCAHEKQVYVIIEKDGKIGCSCHAMIFNCTGNEVCKHIAAFQGLKNPPAAKPTSKIVLDLLAAGWRKSEHGNLYPPDVEQKDTEAAERKAEVNSAMDASWNKTHPETEGLDPMNEDKPLGNLGVGATSDEDGEEIEGDPVPTEPPKRPPVAPPGLGEKVFSRSCPHCDERIEGTDLDDVKRRHREHIATCAKRLKGNDITQEIVQDALDNMPIISAKVGGDPKTIKNIADEVSGQKEETKMVENTTEQKQDVEKIRGITKKSVKDALENMPIGSQGETVESIASKTYTHPDGTGFTSAEALIDYADAQEEIAQMNETKALITPAQPDQATQIIVPTWSDEQLETMRKTVAEKATPAEFAYFLNVAAATGLNPFLREIYFMKTDKGQTAIITGRDGYLTIAKRDPRFRGIQSMEVCKSDEFGMRFVDGRMDVTKHQITDFMDRGEIIGAWARGQMEGQDPVTMFVSIKEYDKGGNIWQRYKSAMIRKVAELMVLKRIAGISGLVTEAEISDSKDIVLDAEVV